MSRTLKIVLIALLIFVLIGLGLVYYYFIFSKDKTGNLPTTDVSSSAETQKVTKITDPGVTWLDPVKLDDLGLLKIGQDENILEVKYYRIATLEDGGELIMVACQFNEPSLGDILRFKKTSDGNYVYLAKQSTRTTYDEISKSFTDKVFNFDPDTTYQSLTPPTYLTVKNTTLKQSSNFGIFSDLKNPKLVTETSYGNIYQTTPINSEVTEIGGVSWALKLVDSTYALYTIKFSFLTDDEVAKINWNDASENDMKYTAEGYTGCAMTASNNIILNTQNISNRLTEAGKTYDNSPIYIPSKDDKIIEISYSNYLVGRNDDHLSLDEFSTKKPVFVYKSGLGVYVVFTARDYGSLAECGKPVIYLYPEIPTKVKVEVGAQITKSEPEYQNGWEALAYPNGKLKVAQKIYDYLFWEGRGQDYPLINAGTIIPKAEAQNTIKTQLGKLGLNTKETNDFLAFWLPKMPNSPYIRLTWFGTSQVDKIAPLTVNPKPDTIIRVFLDFEGLNSPINIQPQNLSSIPRKGFTLVEWGGLLRSN